MSTFQQTGNELLYLDAYFGLIFPILFDVCNIHSFYLSTVQKMQVQESSLLVIPNNFAANLWHVVNDPDIPAIEWDSQGEVVIIDKYSIEKQVLSPSNSTLNSCHAFGAISFLSFIRKLYAYGFKKAPHPLTIHPNIYQFFNPNFKKNRPELLSLVSRSAPKYRRIQKSDPRAKFVPKNKTDKKDVCVQCEDGEETLQEG